MIPDPGNSRTSGVTSPENPVQHHRPVDETRPLPRKIIRENRRVRSGGVSAPGPLRSAPRMLLNIIRSIPVVLMLLLPVPGRSAAAGQAPSVTKVEPPNWWTGMKTNRIELMLYGRNLGAVRITSSSPAIRIVRTEKIENPSYAFVQIEISPSAMPGTYTLKVHSDGGSVPVQFPVLKRSQPESGHEGFGPDDVIYLITPDRFANGDTSNDNVPGMADTLNRRDPFGRHGGDLRGIIDRLAYLKDLGVTALWLNPVVENNMQHASYHGYGATDLYRIDPRFGSNDLYRDLVRKAHGMGLKVIMDHVNNHIGISHPWIADLPTPDWLNGTVEHHQKAFNSKPELDDVHSDSVTKQKAVNGWFADYQVDLNQRNPLVADYLLESTLWWIEFSGIDGIREDTYPYIEPSFRESWCAAVMKEYPRFNIVGEVWVQDPAFLAPYQKGSRIPRRIPAQLPAITDFGLFDAFMKAFADTAGRIENVFTCLAKDFLYPDPDNLVTFLDNHDIRRIMYNVNGDARRFRVALLTLLTTRGIPEILYGTEIGMTGGPDHGTIRSDFPGGFPGDTRNAFSAGGRTEAESTQFDYTRRLLRIRRAEEPLRRGKLIHFKPADEVYVYFRIWKEERVMVIVNHNRNEKQVPLEPYLHQLAGAVKLKELMSGTAYDLGTTHSVTIDGMTGGIYKVIAGEK